MINNYREELSKKNDNEQHSTTPQKLHDFSDLASLPSSILNWIDRNMNGFITLWDQNGMVIYISESVEQLIGFSVSEMIGSKWHKWVSPEDISYIINNLEDIQQGKQIFNINIQNVYGKNIWTENQVSTIHDESGHHYFISSTKDITDKKEAEEMMIRSEKMSVAGQLAAGIAHEIRNPLTSIKGFLQLLQAGVNRDEEYYSIIVDEIEKMETITSELLFISKPMTNHKKMENLPEMIDDVVTLLKPHAELKKIDIQWKQEINQDVNCDRSQIKQVFINLLKNAIEAMEDSGYINVNNYLHHNAIFIDIIDEGPGIPEEVMHKLGEPFFTTKQNGTGLGLMITRQILERHGGKLKILQNGEIGSIFRVILPIP